MSFKLIYNSPKILQEFRFRLLLWKNYDWTVVYLIYFTAFYILTFQVAILWDKEMDSGRNSNVFGLTVTLKSIIKSLWAT